MTSSSEPQRRDERKLVTVLFADLVGSTELAEGLDPERLQSLLQAYFRAMTAVIERWGGTVEKYIGDAIMAVFGVPRAHEDDPRRAVAAALDMIGALEELNLAFRSRYGVALRVRIGVNTGQVLAPVGGPGEQMLVVGDAVNVAARLEQAADAGTVLVGERTHAATHDAFDFEGPRQLELRGKSQPVAAWHAIRAASARSLAPISAPIVGRERERRVLADALDDAIQTRRPRTVVVFGAAGIGKSRLVREAVEDAAALRTSLTVLRGRCLSAGNGISYWALGEIVRGAFGIALDEEPGAAAELLADGVRRQLATSGLAEDDVRRTVNALATSSGIRLDGNPLDQLRPIAVVEELAEAWPRYLSARAGDASLIVLIEDLHWADDQLLAILDSIRSRTLGPVLIIATARPEFREDHPDLDLAKDGSTSIALRPLSADAAGDVLDNLGGRALPGSVRQGLLDRAEGNPFFIEQLVGALVDAGSLVRDERGWAFTAGASELDLPDTVQAVLGARIDRLEPGEKAVLQEAAVVGRTFWPGAIGVAIEPELVTTSLRSLEAKGLVAERPASSLAEEAEFAFRHALILDVAYGSVPLSRRARSHARVAAWLDAIAADADEGVVELLAHHYRMAVVGQGADLAWADEAAEREAVRKRAVPALIAAGALARKRNAIDRGVELHTAALEVADTDAERAAALEELGDDHGWGYHGDPSVTAWTEALELRRTLGDDKGVARIAVKVGRSMGLYWGGFATRPAGATIDRYVDEGLARATARETRAWLLALHGRATEAWAAEGVRDPRPIEDRIAAAEEAAALARDIADPTLQLVALRTLTGLQSMAGNDRRALELAREELGLRGDAALRDRILSMHQAGAVIMDVGGDLQAAREIFERAHEMTADRTAHERMHATYFLMAALYRFATWDELEPLAREHLATFDEETVDIACPYTRSGPVVAAIVLARLGDEAGVADAVTRIVPNPQRPGLVEAWIAERELRLGDARRARETCNGILAAGRLQSLEEPPYELPVLVETIAPIGDDDATTAAILERAEARRSRVAWLGPAIDRAMGLRHAAAGDARAARAALDRALDAYRRLGMPADITRVESDLQELRAPV